MIRPPSIRTGLTSEEIKQDFRENLRCGLGRAERFARSICDYCERVWNIKPGH